MASTRQPSGTSRRQSSGLWSTFESLYVRSEDGSQYSSITEFKPDWKLYLGFASLCTLVFAVGLDAMSLGTALPIISSSFDSTTTQAIWAATSLTLASTIFSLVFVSFSSIFGRKPMMIVATIFFAAGGIATSFTHDIFILLVGRTLQGVGSGAIIVLTEVIITGLVPQRVRGTWFGIINLFWAAGAAGGPVIGGVMAENGLWRWLFRLGMPMCALAGATIPFCLKFQVKRKISKREELARFDWLGMILFIISFTALLMAISMGGVTYPWSNWRTLALIGAGSVTAFIFIIFESLYCKNPLIRLYLFNNGTTAITFLCTFLHGFILWSLLFYLPLYYQAVKGFSPTRSGIAILPETLTIAPVSLLFGLLVSRTGRYKWSVFAGWALTTMGVSFFMLLDANTVAPIWICLNTVVGIGMGILFSGMAISAQATSTALGQGSAFSVSMLHFFRFFGATTGIATCSTIFQSEMRKTLLSLPKLADQATKYTHDAIRMALVIKTLPRDGDERKGLTQAYADGLQKVWLGLCVVAIVGTLTCVFGQEYSLDAKREIKSAWGKKGQERKTSYQSVDV